MYDYKKLNGGYMSKPLWIQMCHHIRLKEDNEGVWVDYQAMKDLVIKIAKERNIPDVSETRRVIESIVHDKAVKFVDRIYYEIS